MSSIALWFRQCNAGYHKPDNNVYINLRFDEVHTHTVGGHTCYRTFVLPRSLNRRENSKPGVSL